MLPAPYNFTKARRLLSQFIEAKSEAIPHSWRTRRVTRGGEEKIENYAVRGRAICDGAEKTIWAIYRMAINQAERIRQTPQLSLEDHCVSNVPPVATNCKELCRAGTRGMRVSDRTVRSHINAGLALGIFTKKKFRGTRANFYVWVNPEFLWETLVETPEVAHNANFQKAQNPRSEGRQSTNFPLNKLLPVVLKEIETGNVDKLVMPSTPGDGGSINLREEEGRRNEKTATGGAGAASEPRSAVEMRAQGGAAQVPVNRPKPGISPRQRAMVEEFTFTAWRELYTPRAVTFNESESREFMNAVYKGVYGGFRDNWSEATWLRYHEEALERIGLAAAYFNRNAGVKYPAHPYAEYVPGTGYFDADNQRGFVKTHDWLDAQLANRRRRKIAEALKCARREWRQHLQGNAPKRVQQRGNLLELFRYHENKFKQWGSEALNRFYANFQHPASSLSKVPVA